MSAEQAPALSNITYDEIEVGKKLGTISEPVERDLAARLTGPIGQPVEAGAVPPAVFPVLFLKGLRRSLGGIPNGGVLAKQEFEFGEPLAIGDTVEIDTWVSDKYVRRDRPYVVVEYEVRDGSGATALTGRKIIMWPTGPGER
jgi:acyl dehydratase